jgi:hypothetical protein
MLTTSENDFAKFRSEGGIVVTEFKAGCVLGSWEAGLVLADRLAMQPIKKCGLLFDLSPLGGCSKAGRDLLFTHGLSVGTCAAFVCRTPLTISIVSFCLSTYTLSIPSGVFKSEDAATAFLKLYANKNWLR